jgi:hypothetical protein
MSGFVQSENAATRQILPDGSSGRAPGGQTPSSTVGRFALRSITAPAIENTTAKMA